MRAGPERPRGALRRLRGTVAVAAALAVSTVGACAPRPSPSDDGPAAAGEGPHGCWSLTVTAEGEEPGTLPSWLPRRSVPEVVELDSARLRPGEEGGPYRAHSWIGGRREGAPFSAWAPIEGSDSLRVERPGALAGLQLRLAPSDGALAGVLVSFTDAVEPGDSGRRTAAARAERVACPGPAKESGGG